MKVILLQDIKGVGKKDEIINAADGHARNYLLPRKLAVEANNENLSKLKDKKVSAQHKKDVEKKNAQALALKIKDMTIKMKVKAGENGKLFGAITSKDISENLLKNYKMNIDKKKIVLDEAIKVVGAYNATIKLYEGITANLKIIIEA